MVALSAALLIALAVPTARTDAGAAGAGGRVEYSPARSSVVLQPPTRLIMGDEVRLVKTTAGTVGDLLAAEGIDLQPGDRVSPGVATPVFHGMQIAVTIFRDLIEHEEETIPSQGSWRYDFSLPLGQKAIVQPGVAGVTTREYEVRTVNGEEVSRELVAEETIAPTDEFHLVGMNADLQSAAPPSEGQCVSRMSVWTTYYTAASAGGTVTRTGTPVFKGVVATDPSVIPLGTRMYVPGYGYGVAADTGGGVKGAHIDLAYGVNDVYDWGAWPVEICLLD